MIPELGQFALILALAVAVIQTLLPILDAAWGRTRWMAVARPAANAQLLFVALSYAALTWAFVVDDFSVAYVAHNGNMATPMIYKISSV